MKFLFEDFFTKEKSTEIVSEISKQSVVLRDYQIAAVNNAYACLEKHQSTLINLPTGTGKSVCFSEFMRRWEGGRILLMAHRKELIYQAVGHAGRANLTAGVEMGAKRCRGDEDVIVSSVQTLIAPSKCQDCMGAGCSVCGGSGKVRRMTRFSPFDFGLLVIDEAHHAVADSYRTIMGFFGRNPNMKELLVTATPQRADKKGLHNICTSVAYEMSLPDAIDLGWLVPIRQKFVTVDGLDLSKVDVSKGDLVASQLESAFLGTDEDEERMLHAIAKPAVDLAAGRSTLVFSSGKEHAVKLTAAFNAYEGVTAACVIEDTDPLVRDQVISDYKAGRIQILVNCMVFTEGFDAPNTAVIVNCRPTKSESLIAQIIGRVTRPLPGVVDGPQTPDERKQAIADSAKPYGLVLDFVGNSGRHKIVTTIDILCGDKVDPLDIEEALKVAQKSEEPVDMEELAEKAKQAREEREKRKELDRLLRLTTSNYANAADYSAVDVSLFTGENFEFQADDQPATKKQAGFMNHFCGIPFKQGIKLTSRQANAIISESRHKAASDWEKIFSMARSKEDLRRAGLQLNNRKSKDRLISHNATLSRLRDFYNKKMKDLD